MSKRGLFLGTLCRRKLDEKPKELAKPRSYNSRDFPVPNNSVPTFLLVLDADQALPSPQSNTDPVGGP